VRCNALCPLCCSDPRQHLPLPYVSEGVNYFMALTGVKRDEFAWTKNKPGTFRSSELVERDFCPKCGTPLTYRALDLDRISVSIGSLDDPSSIHLEQQYGTESAAVDLVEMAKLPGVRTDQWATPERLAKLASRQHPDHH
jgi:hypothetical protein